MTITAAEAIDRGCKARKERNLAEARKAYAEAAAIYRGENDLLAYAHSIRHIADIYRNESNPGDAKPLYEEALEIYRSNLSTGILDLANTVRPYALLIETQGDPDQARVLWEEARNLYASLRIDAGVDECNRHISELRQV